MQPSLAVALIAGSHADTFVADAEGLRFTSYLDGANVCTIGCGHTGPDVYEGLTWNRDQCIAALAHDLLTADHAVVNEIQADLNQNQFDALVSFTFNLGRGALAVSSVRKNIEAGNLQQAADSMLLWNKLRDPATGQLVYSVGLYKRRVAERELFLRPV